MGRYCGVVRQHRTIYLFFTVFVRNFPGNFVRLRSFWSNLVVSFRAERGIGSAGLKGPPSRCRTATGGADPSPAVRDDTLYWTYTHVSGAIPAILAILLSHAKPWPFAAPGTSVDAVPGQSCRSCRQCNRTRSDNAGPVASSLDNWQEVPQALS